MNALSDLQSWILFGLLAGMIVLGIADYYTTMIGLQHGDVEKNPLAKWLQSKLGLPLSTFLTLGVYTFTAGITAAHFGTPVLYIMGGATVAEGINVWNNFHLLKSQGISLK